MMQSFFLKFGKVGHEIPLAPFDCKYSIEAGRIDLNQLQLEDLLLAHFRSNLYLKHEIQENSTSEHSTK